RKQVVDMVNWWFRETGALNARVRQIALWNLPPNSPTVPPPELKYGTFVNAPDGVGTGLIKAEMISKGIEVSGHSLGGYLASAFVRLFNVQLPGVHAATFNGAGFSFRSDQAFQGLESLLGPGLGAGINPSEKQQDNFYAENGINFVTNDWWFEQSGVRQPIFNEESTIPVGNHSMYKLTDTMTLAD
ncbi:hypothetical protein, partial [Massilia genomosp. 1]|uniref:hypothetical protein n=1 Tax=Massilia genomosp. 1 TaxID=2609280 RepID=UPI00142212D8